jgi:uncharacterized protein
MVLVVSDRSGGDGMSAFSSSKELVAELHRRQEEMYSGGPVEPVLELLSPDIIWHIPGESPIAGNHRGFAQVIDYFERRRRLASKTMRMYPGAATVFANSVVQFVEGSAVLNGEQVSWQTLGIYCINSKQHAIHEAWLIPLESELFDRIWSGHK